jgi:hypothetical protein
LVEVDAVDVATDGFNFLFAGFAQRIGDEGVLFFITGFEKFFPKVGKALFGEVTFEEAFLNADAVVFAEGGNPAKTARGGDVGGDEVDRRSLRS